MKHKSTKNGTLKHINNVQVKLSVFMNELNNRGLNHDRSKLEPPEMEIFDKYTPKLKYSSYPSKQYDHILEKMKPALKHHYDNNRHHPEHFEINGISGMNLVDLVEMFCDWIAATERHIDGDIFKSIDFNKDRFEISDQLAQIFRNTAFELFDKKPVVKVENDENDK